jgi:hypothetical protein
VKEFLATIKIYKYFTSNTCAHSSIIYHYNQNHMSIKIGSRKNESNLSKIEKGIEYEIDGIHTWIFLKCYINHLISI